MTDLGYASVTIYKTHDTGWGYRANYVSGREEVGGVFCDADCSPDEAVSAWCSEHLGYGGKTPTRIERVKGNQRRLVWEPRP